MLTAAHCMVNQSTCTSLVIQHGITMRVYGGLFDSTKLEEKEVQNSRAQWTHHKEYCDNQVDFQGETLTLTENPISRIKVQFILPNVAVLYLLPSSCIGFDIGIGKLDTPFKQSSWLRPTNTIYGHKTSHPEFWSTAEGDTQEYYLPGMGKSTEKEKCGFEEQQENSAKIQHFAFVQWVPEG